MRDRNSSYEQPDNGLDEILARALGPHEDAAPPPDLAQRIITATADRVTAHRRPVLARLGRRRLWAAAAMAAACAVALGLLWRLGLPQPPTTPADTSVAAVENAWPSALDRALAAITSRPARADIDAELALLDYDIDYVDRLESDSTLADAAAALDELLRQWEHHADDGQVGVF